MATKKYIKIIFKLFESYSYSTHDVHSTRYGLPQHLNPSPQLHIKQHNLTPPPHLPYQLRLLHFTSNFLSPTVYRRPTAFLYVYNVLFY